jgi:hypothetical protein
MDTFAFCFAVTRKRERRREKREEEEKKRMTCGSVYNG